MNVSNYPAVQPISGTVDIGTIPEVEIKNDVGNPIPVSGVLDAIIQGSPTVTFQPTSLDAFGRLRISNPVTLFDSSLRYHERHDFDTATANGGTLTYDFNASVRRLTVTNQSGSQVIRESLRVFPYQPGKSLLILNSFVMAPAISGLQQRIGYFTTNNGVYFDQTNTTKSFVIRSYGGAVTEESIPQSQWNGDKLDGTGPSGLTLNLNASQIFWIDIEWLGVGTVRCGFIINGQYIVCHSFHHANLSQYSTTYMGTATLPVRCEITNLTATTASSSMFQQICSTVISEGGYTPYDITETAGTGINEKGLSTANIYYPIASIRLAPGRLNSIVIPRQIDILSPTVNYYRWVLLYNATLTGATWTGLSSTGTVQYDTGATAVSGGTELQSGFVSSRQSQDLGSDMFQYQLGRYLNGTSEMVTLALASTSNNAQILAQLGWQELT